MIIPFVFYHRTPSESKIASSLFAKYIHWKSQDIVHVVREKGRFTVPGKFVYHAYPREIPVASVIEPGTMPSETTWYKTEAQEFEIVHYERVMEHHFNRKSGRYLFSDVVCTHGEKRHEWVEYLKLPRLGRQELREAER